MTTEERLERLERDLRGAKRCIRWLLVGTALAVSGLCIAWVESGAVVEAKGQQGVAQEIRANSFILVDGAGRARAALGMGNNGAALELYDEAGTRRTELSDKLALYDEAGTLRVVLTGGREVSWAVYDKTGSVRAALGPVLAQGVALVFSDEAATPRVWMGVTETGASLELFDKAGTARANFGAGVYGRQDGRRTTHPESSLLLSGPDGDVIWQAPR